MSSPRIVCVTPTCRPEQYAKFKEVWAPLFKKHRVLLITVHDGSEPQVEYSGFDTSQWGYLGGSTNTIKWSPLLHYPFKDHRDLFCRHTDAVRNMGFVCAARLKPDYVMTLDDDVAPCMWNSPRMGETGFSDDPIQAHIDALKKRVPITWMNTAHDESPYLRGVPYDCRAEAPVMLSHGVWVGTPDFDGETQARMEGWTSAPDGGLMRVAEPDKYMEPSPLPKPFGGYRCAACGSRDGEFRFKSPAGSIDSGYFCKSCNCIQPYVGHSIPESLSYFVGPVPRGCLFPLCGMNVMVRSAALPYLYFAPMGPDTGITRTELVNKNGKQIRKGDLVTADMVEQREVPALNRFADIFMGITLKRKFDELGWACYTGGSTVLHTRASDAVKNFEAEKLGRRWLEWLHRNGADEEEPEAVKYFTAFREKCSRYAELISKCLEGKFG